MKTILDLLGSLLLQQPIPEDDLHRSAYRAGYDLGETGAKNPHRKGSTFYRSWAHGRAERQRSVMQQY